MNRLHKSKLPDEPSYCEVVRCVYNKNGVCDEPRTNKGNSDAICHRWSNKKVIEETLIIYKTPL